MRRDADYDLLTCGLFFNDMTFSGLPDAGPQPGLEQRVGPYTQTPGGIANASLAAVRLGLSVCMVADAGDDPFSVGALAVLAEEGIDTCHCLIHPGWQAPLTVILNYAGDRAMVTSETAHPGDCMLRAKSQPSAKVAITHLQPFPMPWVQQASAAGTIVVGDIGWDDSGNWNLADLPDLSACHAFTPNEVEARHYTGHDDPIKALHHLGNVVRMPIVTLGCGGVLALDAATGEQVHVPSLPGPVVDTGGAGDVFSAGLAAGLVAELSLTQTLRLGTLIAALTIAEPGGATTAPTLLDCQGWVRAASTEIQRDYGFVLDLGWDWSAQQVRL